MNTSKNRFILTKSNQEQRWIFTGVCMLLRRTRFIFLCKSSPYQIWFFELDFWWRVASVPPQLQGMKAISCSYFLRTRVHYNGLCFGDDFISWHYKDRSRLAELNFTGRHRKRTKKISLINCEMQSIYSFRLLTPSSEFPVTVEVVKLSPGKGLHRCPFLVLWAWKGYLSDCYF